MVPLHLQSGSMQLHTSIGCRDALADVSNACARAHTSTRTRTTCSSALGDADIRFCTMQSIHGQAAPDRACKACECRALAEDGWYPCKAAPELLTLPAESVSQRPRRCTRKQSQSLHAAFQKLVCFSSAKASRRIPSKPPCCLLDRQTCLQCGEDVNSRTVTWQCLWQQVCSAAYALAIVQSRRRAGYWVGPRGEGGGEVFGTQARGGREGESKEETECQCAFPDRGNTRGSS